MIPFFASKGVLLLIVAVVALFLSYLVPAEAIGEIFRVILIALTLKFGWDELGEIILSFFKETIYVSPERETHEDGFTAPIVERKHDGESGGTAG